MIITGENQSTHRKPHTSATFSPSPTWTGLGLNMDLHSKKPVTNCLSHSTAKYLVNFTQDACRTTYRSSCAVSVTVQF